MIISAAQRLASVEEYYFSHKLRQIRELNMQGKAIINLGIGSPDLMPSNNTIAALQNTATQMHAHGYQGYTGIPALRAAMAKWYKKTYGVDLNPQNEVLPLMGSKEGIMHISMAFLNPGDRVYIPNPGYLTYTSVSKLLGAQAISYVLAAQNNWQPNFEAMQAALHENTKILWVNYPHMPTGTRASRILFDKIVAFAHKNRLLVVNDNPYSLVLNEHPQSILQADGAKEVAIELNSLSKSHNMAGWRVGMLVGNSNYLQQVLKVKSNMDSGMFLGIQQAAIEALQNPSDWHAQQNAIYAKRKLLALQLLQQLSCTPIPNQVGMFVWAKVPQNIQNVRQWVDDILHKAEVFITPGFIFGSAGNAYVRISLCSSTHTFETALKRIKQYVNQNVVLV